MSATFTDRLCQVTYKALDLFILCVVAIGIVLLTLANPAIAIDPRAGGYISPAAVPVTMEPLAALPGAVPMALLATGPPSEILLLGKAKMAKRLRLPPQFIVGKAVINSAGDKIGMVTKIDRALVVVDVSGNSDTGPYDIGLNWNHFTSNGNGKGITLLTNMSTSPLRDLPEYRSLD